MKRFFGFILVAGIASWVLAQDTQAPKPQSDVDQLIARINELEKRVADLENANKPTEPSPATEQPVEQPAEQQYSTTESNYSLDDEGEGADKRLEELRNKYRGYNGRNFNFERGGLDRIPELMLDGIQNGMPRGSVPREFNGFRYYIVPLSGDISSSSPITTTEVIAP